LTGLPIQQQFGGKEPLRIPSAGSADRRIFTGLAVYLASDESSWVTGAVLPVDEGYLAV